MRHYLHKPSRFEPYTMQSSDHSKTLTFTVAVACHGRERSRSGKHKKPRTLLYAVLGTSVPRRLPRLKPLKISAEYSRRFGIESSYRQLNEARGRTSSRSPMLRLLYAGIALLLRNLWVLCRWIVSAHLGPGARSKDSLDLTFELLLDWLKHHLAQLLQEGEVGGGVGRSPQPELEGRVTDLHEQIHLHGPHPRPVQGIRG